MQASPSLASSFLSFVCVGVGVGAKCGTKRKCGNRYARWQATRQNSEASPGGRVDRTALRHPTLVPAVWVCENCCPPASACRSLSPPKGDTASPLQRGVEDTRRTPHHTLQAGIAPTIHHPRQQTRRRPQQQSTPQVSKPSTTTRWTPRIPWSPWSPSSCGR